MTEPGLSQCAMALKAFWTYLHELSEERNGHAGLEGSAIELLTAPRRCVFH